MELIEQVKEICTRLAPHGWKDLLLEHGLDISLPNLKVELLRDLSNINRKIKGFEDFALEGKRGIEPRIPSRSLLYHALVSPNVVSKVDGSELGIFPTLEDIEIVENYVYGITPLSIAEIEQETNGRQLSLAVFASEYRTASKTVHKKHADKCFSLTGVSRIGTKEALYDPKSRGFLHCDTDENTVRVLPSKFSVYIAVKEKGNKNIFGPMRFRDEDNNLDFWVPLYKIFSGSECIRGFNLNVQLEAFHINEKLKRIHLRLRGNGGWSEPSINEKPFIFSDEIAEFSTNPDDGSGLLVPIVHSKLVEPAEYQGKPLTFIVPQNTPILSSSMAIPAEGDYRFAPEYVHVRHKIDDNGTEENLNDKPNVSTIVGKGGYRARHYIDFTGDGWIKPACLELEVEFPNKIPAYSLVTAPDFFPHADQGELMDWWETRASQSEDIRELTWRIAPLTLADSRISPNLQLPESGFKKEYKTYTAIISLPLSGQIQLTTSDSLYIPRHSYLPDAASSVYQPGWDVSLSRTNLPDATEHLAAYGLGSPFPEDSKLCSALSTFWPGVAPDAARTFEPDLIWPTVCPLTDEEIGIIGNSPWDGIKGPKLIREGNEEQVEYTQFAYGDYIETALNNKFSLKYTGLVNIEEYKARLIAMVKVYKFLNARRVSERGEWSVQSFTIIDPNIDDDELLEAQNQTNVQLNGQIYRFFLYKHGNIQSHPTDHRKIRVKIRESITIFMNLIQILSKKNNQNQWQADSIEL